MSAGCALVSQAAHLGQGAARRAWAYPARQPYRPAQFQRRTYRGLWLKSLPERIQTADEFGRTEAQTSLILRA